MTYQEKTLFTQSTHKKIAFWILLNLAVLVLAYFYHFSFNVKSIAIAGGVLLGIWLVILFTKKISKKQTLKKKALLIKHQNDEILYEATQYFGGITAINPLIALLSIVYEAIWIFICYQIYQTWFDSTLLIWSLCGISFILFIPLFIIALRSPYNKHYFTPTHILLHHRVALAYEDVRKYQFIELIKSGYLLDLNSGDIYIRLFIKNTDFASVQALLNTK